MITGIHHINFLVKDLDKGIALYEKKLGIGPFEKDALPARGVVTARAKIGATWLVLVMPTEDDTAPARHLAKHGEGFFLLSFEVEDLDTSIQHFKNQGLGFDPDQPRQGLLNWRVIDCDQQQTLGALLQLTQEHHRD